MRMHLLPLLAVFAAPWCAIASDQIQFNRDVRPILSETCFKCHGPDSSAREADLRLDLEESAKRDLGGYAAIVPGDPDNSEMIRRVFSEDPDLRMPPPESGLSLTIDHKGLLRRWIVAGADYQMHWAFEPIRRPDLPKAVSAREPIDAFILARLNDAGLTPMGPADPVNQLRRVTLDLTGLPPTLDEIDSFLESAKQQGLDVAYEAAVDRLLDSPRYGERMAWQWLEAARYADTDGYQNDGPREMWRWRDWVIDAYNQNMPFDQFTIEQLAGDLLPNPSHEQLIATAFNRNHRYNSEEGIPIDEFLLENAVDRVDTTATVWMGLTFGCARCHDHKYDPFSQREYYQLIDYFNDVAESGRAVKFGNSEPWIKTPTDRQRARLRQLDARIEEAKRALQSEEDEIAAAQRRWEEEGAPCGPVLSDGLDYYFSFDGEQDGVTVAQGQPILGEGLFGNAATFGGNGQFQVGAIPGLIGNGRFSIAFWMNPEDVDHGAVLSNEQPDTKRAGILVEFVDGRLRWNINTRWISGVSTIESVRKFTPGEWVHITLTNDGTQRAQGMKLYIDGKLQDVTTIRNTNSNTAKRAHGGPMNIGYSKHVGFWAGQVDELRFYTARTLTSLEARMLAVRADVRAIATFSADARSKIETKLLRTAFLECGADARHSQLLTSLRQAMSERTAYWDSLPTTMIMADLPGGRPSFVRIRGVYDQLGEAVEPGVPAIFPALPLSDQNDRLAFAKWLVNGQHPLIARVVVNRYWQMLFGKGLVATAEDFGTQGELPSHPELLDWLAIEFMESGWNVKHTLKTIVMSGTYRRSSRVTSRLLKSDPDNRLLGRAPRLRLPGNILRDQALFVSGLLVEKIGGPSVNPYQPAGLWEEASNAKYTMGKGDDLYRRSLYTYWKRTLAPPTMSLLDTADREWCSVRPRRTNTPLQALALLNEMTFAESARRLAERILDEGGTSDEAKITFAFRTLAAREPTDDEKTLLASALDDYRSEFRKNPAFAADVLTLGQSPTTGDAPPIEVAAMTALANMLLNLDEVTTRE